MTSLRRNNLGRRAWYAGTSILYTLCGRVFQLDNSNKSQVTLRNVDFGLSGTFICEVTADAPTFSTASALKNLSVVCKYMPYGITRYHETPHMHKADCQSSVIQDHSFTHERIRRVLWKSKELLFFFITPHRVTQAYENWLNCNNSNSLSGYYWISVYRRYIIKLLVSNNGELIFPTKY